VQGAFLLLTIQTAHLVTSCKHLLQQVQQHGPPRTASQEWIFLLLVAVVVLVVEVPVVVVQAATSKHPTTP
jgi:hypothetical protein